jgi:hypothetical protein
VAAHDRRKRFLGVALRAAADDDDNNLLMTTTDKSMTPLSNLLLE